MTPRIGILGFGREGRSALRHLAAQPKFRHAEFVILDARFDTHYLDALATCALIVRSPGVYRYRPELVAAEKRGVQFTSATKLFFEKCPGRIVGVTGTKGKGTTSTLLYKILRAAGRDVVFGGNVGIPMLDVLGKIKKTTTVVLELSSFQLQDLGQSPEIAVVLDAFPDHQDSHRSLREYYTAKSEIAKHQRGVDKVFFAANNPNARWIARHGRGKKIAVDPKHFTLFRANELRMPGEHNMKNAVMAATVARALGVPDMVIKRVATNFPGNEHRLEFVRRIGDVSFWNDSASTNPLTTAAAARAFPGTPGVLILGGKDKNLDYEPLTRALRNSSIRHIMLLGENVPKITHAFRALRIPRSRAHSLADAVSRAYRIAHSLPPTPRASSCVLFSPGAASFDMFRDYADRGQQFKALVKKLKSI